MRLATLFGHFGADHQERLAHVLRGVPLFRDALTEDLVSVWRHFTEVDVPAGTVLCRLGDPGDRFYVLKRGAAAVSLGAGAKRALVRQLAPGDFFGEMSLFTGEPRSADVVVTEEATLWVLEREDFDAVMSSASLLRSVIRSLCGRLSSTTGQLAARDSGGGETESGLRFGPYRVIEQLGAGGHAAVYSAVHVDTEAAAAVKVLPAAWGQSPLLQRRLRQEAAALQRVRHPHVIRVLEVGEVAARLGGGCYLAMEWLPSALNRALHAQFPEPFAPATALRIARGVSEGLAAVHAVGMAHRDIKPSNILLRADGTPVLTDFGLVAALRELAYVHRLTPADSFVGSADYIAPEQVASDEVDERSDLYSLGIVLYELLTGHVPFAGRTPMDTLRAQTDAAPPPLPAAIPPRTRAVVEQLLQKDPRDRFQTAAALSEALSVAWAEAQAFDPGAEHRAYLRTVAGRSRGWTGLGKGDAGGPAAREAREEPRLTLEWWDEGRWLPLDFGLVDVCQGGMGVLCPDPPIVGAQLRITLALGGEGEGAGRASAGGAGGGRGTIETMGRVVYEAAAEVGLGVPTYRCGIAFEQAQPRLVASLAGARAWAASSVA